MRRSMFSAWVFLAFSIAVPSGSAHASCVNDSTQTLDAMGNQISVTLISSAPCGVYGTANSRFERVGSVETQIVVPYMTHTPATKVKAIAVLLAGSDGETGITPDPCGSASTPCSPVPVLSTNNNFLVRSAQLFAENGFKAITIDRPSPLPSGDQCGTSSECYEIYRQSQRHALDIAAVVKKENPHNKSVFLVGTSRGAISAVAQNLMATGSMLSSPVTLAPLTSTTAGIPSPCDHLHKAFVDDCFYTELQPAAVKVPVQILVHAGDTCFVSPPSEATIVKNDFVAGGVQTFFFQETGGFELVGGDPCEAQSFHGYLGIENAVVDRITHRMTLIRRNINLAAPGDHAPHAGNGNYSITAGTTPATFDLASLASDPDVGDTLTFALVHLKSTRAVPLSIAGSVVTYDVASAGLTGPTVKDAFVYTATDSHGKKRFGIVRVNVTVP
jgi:hypothetical protein